MVYFQKKSFKLPLMITPKSSKVVQLNERVVSTVILEFGAKDATFKIASVTLPDLYDGLILVKPLYFSNDPAQRMWIEKPNPKSDEVPRSYLKGPEIGEPMPAFGMAEVMKSASGKYLAGDKIIGKMYWAEYCVIPEQQIFNKVEESLGFPLTHYLSFLGFTGLTAYFGLLDVGKLQKGQTVVISAASGATGSMAVQIAKHLFEAGKVIAISSSEEKCKWVESLGADKCLSYKSQSFQKDLAAAIGPDFADVYFDNVGGEVLDFMLKHVKDHGRVVACGAVSTYNDPEKRKIFNWSSIITQKLTIEGFIFFQFVSRFPEAVAALAEGIKEGKIESTEGVELVDLSGKDDFLVAVVKTWATLFTPEKGNGKLISKV